MTENFMKASGGKLLKARYPIVPIREGTKAPVGIANWQNLRATEADVRRWADNGYPGIGIKTKYLPALDIDVHDPYVVQMVLKVAESVTGAQTFPFLKRVGAAPKTLVPFRVKDTTSSFTKIQSRRYKSEDGNVHRLEVLGDGQQYVAYAMHPGTGLPYSWNPTGLLSHKPGHLPVLTREHALRIIEYFEELADELWVCMDDTAPTSAAPSDAADGFEAIVPKTNLSEAQILRALQFIDPEDCDYDRWVFIGMALHHQYDGDTRGLEIWEDWCSNCSKFQKVEGRKRWKSFVPTTRNKRPITFASVLRWAKEGYRKVAAAAVGAVGTGETPPPPGAERKQLPVLRLGGILDKLGPINWLVEDFIEASTTGLLFGEPATYKSFLAIDVALHIAAGKTWHGHNVKQGAVLYLAGEGHGGLARRVAAWQLHNETPARDLPVIVSCKPAQLFDIESVAEVLATIDAHIAELGAPALVVVDTLARNFGGGDENSTADMNLLIENIDTHIRGRYDCSILIVHHTGHADKGRARGSTVLRGGMDYEYRSDLKRPYIMSVTCTKMKDAPAPAPKWFEMEEKLISSFDSDEHITSLVPTWVAPDVMEAPDVKLVGLQLAMRDLIAEHGSLSRAALTTLALENDGGFETAAQVRNALAGLKSKGIIEDYEGMINLLEEK